MQHGNRVVSLNNIPDLRWYKWGYSILFYQSGRYNLQPIQYPMQLMMYIGNDLIESVPLDREQVPIPGYLGKIKRHLKEKYQTMINESSERTEFLVIDPKATAKRSEG